MLNPADIHAIAAAIEHGRRIVSQRRERAHAEWVAARERARQRDRVSATKEIERNEKRVKP